MLAGCKPLWVNIEPGKLSLFVTKLLTLRGRCSIFHARVARRQWPNEVVMLEKGCE